MAKVRTEPFRFDLQKRSGGARAGTFSTPHGAIHTPAFMPVGTAATVKAMYMDQVRALGADHVFDYKKEDYTESGNEYDLIVDMVGNHSLTANRGVLKPNGRLVLVGGPTGSGKSTTLASLINLINETMDHHIITIEDPIEFYHEHIKSTVNQREVGVDVPSFAEAIRRSLRMDPDVILV